MGADLYLTKPVSTEILLDAVAEALRRSSERQTPAPSTSDPSCVMQQFNAVLVQKLEQKSSQLEEALAALRQVYEQQNKWCDSLEGHVRDRTTQLEASNRELTRALAEVKELSGLLPICSYCKKVRDTENSWRQLEFYLAKHSHIQFSYGICPECLERTARPAVENLLAAKTSQSDNARHTGGL